MQKKEIIMYITLLAMLVIYLHLPLTGAVLPRCLFPHKEVRSIVPWSKSPG
jgi:hypothetical protein